MGYNSGAIELGRMNLEKGKVDIAFDIFFDLAKNDLDEDAMYMLSRMTFDGQLNPEQIELFYELQNSASSYGNGYALFNVGLMHERGLGKVKQDYKVAVQYYEKAIKEEMHDAFCNLGNIYALTFFSRLVVITALSSSSAPTRSAAHSGINAESIAGRASMAVTK